MSSQQPNTRFLIIGGGLAGLSLGQGLKKANIPFRIFERDDTASFRAQGYRIRIGPDGGGALQHLLPQHLWEAFKATCAEIAQGGSRLNARTGEKVDGRRGPPPAHGGNGRKWAIADGLSYNADRAVLRSILLSGLEKNIEFRKRFERYEVAANGDIVAHFTDGTKASGSFLIGADGVRSVVRRQLLPCMEVLDTEGRAVFGKTIVNHDLTSQMAPEIGRGISLIGESDQGRLKLFCDGMKWDRERATASGQQLGIEIPPDYIYWVLLFRKDDVSDEQERRLLALTNEQSAKLSSDLTSGWSENIQILLRMQTVEAASPLAFLTAAPDFDTKWWTKPSELQNRITLIGDSAHPMVGTERISGQAIFPQRKANSVHSLQ